MHFFGMVDLMKRASLSDNLSVSGQISPQDIEILYQDGVKSIICNRPDGEDLSQPPFDVLSDQAHSLDMKTAFMPVISGRITHSEGVEFKNLLESLPKPIHAYCRSGTRCAMLWVLSELEKGVDRTSVLESAKCAGYDLSKWI